MPLMLLALWGWDQIMSQGTCSLGYGTVPDPKLGEQALLRQREGGLHASIVQQIDCITLVCVFHVSD